MKTTSYRMKKAEDFAEFVHGERGTDAFPALSVRLECSYKPSFCGYKDGEGRKVRGALMSSLPAGTVTFSRELERWLINPAFLADAIALALHHFKYVYEVCGERITEHHTGQTVEQGSLFG